jgi:hypothetical protein
MQIETKEFLKEFFWGKKKSLIERRTSWGDWSKETPFVLIRQEINDYVWDEYTIIRYIYGDFERRQQRLCVYGWRKIDELDIVCLDYGAKKITVYFDITEVF